MRDAGPVVIGGGPAGSMFALTLARAGRAVTLLEKTKTPLDKVCGEFLSRESGVYLERHGLHPRALGAVPIDTVRLVTPWFQQERELPFPAWSLTRKQLDEALLVHAAGAGVQVVRDARVTLLEKAGERWSASTQNGAKFESGDVVLATGKVDLRGWPRPKGMQPDLVAFKMYYRLTKEQLAAVGNSVELVLYSGGYAGLQPVQGGVVNLCLLIDARRAGTAGLQWADVLRHVLEHSPHLRERLHGAVELLPKPLAASSIPYGHLQRTTAEGFWRVGDQAAVIPSFCGDGTAIALHSGVLAATSLVAGGSSAQYQQKLHKQLWSRMWLATRLSRILIEHPKASHLTRGFPALIGMIASLTRIPESGLVRSTES